MTVAWAGRDDHSEPYDEQAIAKRSLPIKATRSTAVGKF
jgi:hypothetical protein